MVTEALIQENYKVRDWNYCTYKPQNSKACWKSQEARIKTKDGSMFRTSRGFKVSMSSF